MSQLELLEKTVKSLEKANIPYMLTGSLVSSFQGNPRSTHDIDIVVSIKMGDIPDIMETFDPERFYINRESVKEAITISSQFNILDIEEGNKIDFWILTNSDFDKSRFSRRQKDKFFNFEVYISTPEDTIIQKLVWSKLSGGSEKQYKDALSVYELQYGKLDIEYMNNWSKELDIENLYKKMLSDADIEDED
jgi:hypothetical protein